MRRTGLYFALVGILLLALPAAAQEDGGNIAQIISFSAKPGMEKELAEGIKRHLDWHREQNDPWTWLAWEYLSGDNVGTYGAGTFGHSWEDFDNAPVSRDDDDADVLLNIAPYSNLDSIRFYALLAEVSHGKENDAGPMWTIETFRVRVGRSGDFEHLVKKFHDAIQETGWPVHYGWYRLVNGGEGPEYVLVRPRENWAAFNDPEKPFAAMLEEHYGRQEAQSLLEQLWQVVKGVSSTITRSRPEFSYIPEGD